MSYTSLTAAKGTSGALATWVEYTLLDVPVTVDEAQTLLYSILRTREMRSEINFTLPVGGASIALPTGFLDPIGRIFMASVNNTIRHKDQGFVERHRNYTELSGTLGTDPFTTTNGSSLVNVALTGSGFNQDSIFYTTGATLFNGVTISGTFPIVALVDANNFTIDISSIGTATGTGSGGGASVSYICDSLIQGMPIWFGIWDEKIHLDQATQQTTLSRLMYYKSPPLLSSTNQTNWLTNRYPHLLRTACMASAADFMKDDVEYQKCYQRLLAQVQQVNVENDMAMRGMELEMETP